MTQTYDYEWQRAEKSAANAWIRALVIELETLPRAEVRDALEMLDAIRTDKMMADVYPHVPGAEIDVDDADQLIRGRIDLLPYGIATRALNSWIEAKSHLRGVDLAAYVRRELLSNRMDDADVSEAAP